jgi:hypothetical protein
VSLPSAALNKAFPAESIELRAATTLIVPSHRALAPHDGKAEKRLHLQVQALFSSARSSATMADGTYPAPAGSRRHLVFHTRGRYVRGEIPDGRDFGGARRRCGSVRVCC